MPFLGRKGLRFCGPFVLHQHHRVLLSKAPLQPLSPQHYLRPTAVPAQMKNLVFPLLELLEIPLRLSLQVPLTGGTNK